MQQRPSLVMTAAQSSLECNHLLEVFNQAGATARVLQAMPWAATSRTMTLRP